MLSNLIFNDRIEAGILLAKKLDKYKNEQPVILAVPRGGVPVAYAVANELDLPVELILTKKIGHPFDKEFAIGAASLTDYFIDFREHVSEMYIQQELQRVRKRLREMYEMYMGEEQPESYKGKTIIIVDDGMATGNTILSTVKILKKSSPVKIVIAIPVASQSAVDKLSKEVDEVIAVKVPFYFYGVGAFYKNFDQVSDEEVMFYLKRLRKLKKAS